MLLLVPILIIVLSLYLVDFFYFADTTPKKTKESSQKSRDANQSSQNYLDRYIKK
ncbi:MAG: hypothetical protein IBX44_08185 [Sulfurospirillum sp.]|nr:hypothetical protein [Sulfurospirillum sp.]